MAANVSSFGGVNLMQDFIVTKENTTRADKRRIVLISFLFLLIHCLVKKVKLIFNGRER